MRFRPLDLSSAPLSAKSPRYVLPRHLMRSSSIPPAVVTTTSTILFFTKNLIDSLTPLEMRLLVYPRNTLHRHPARNFGSRWSAGSSPVGSSSLSRHEIILLISSAAWPKLVAWNPV